MPDRYWCTNCDVGYTDVVPGNCPHCGSLLVDMEGFGDEEDVSEPEEYDSIEEDQDEAGDGLRVYKKAA